MEHMESRRIEYFGKKAVVLANGAARLIVEEEGGMTPEFSAKRSEGYLNAHWIPDFRSNSGEPWSDAKHGAYWGGKVLYIIAGDFPCSPSFGKSCEVDGAKLPSHGWTATEKWSLLDSGISKNKKATVARFGMKSPTQAMPLRYEKCDMLIGGLPAYHSLMNIYNDGSRPISINVAHHNTLGSPFLQSGCRISLSATRFMTTPEGTEFDKTGRLAFGREFESLSAAPLRSGGTADLSTVPGMIGSTDFVTGSISPKAGLGWSCIVNPVLGMAYVSFFPGMAGLREGEIALSFNDLWMQYGGRPFTPWALHEAGADHTFCLGAENAVGAFANGLEYSRNTPELLGNPTTVAIPAHGKRTLCYGTALVALESSVAGEDIVSIEAEGSALVLKTKRHSQKINLDANFDTAREVEADR
jgi:hypothetical protein